ncbi:TRAP transporter large permease subunit [Streptomyces sp. NPDC051662]|uniref:TRAP transporter large permease subunit n=1 Tax=Streptomyces sp. NPDC051662 TaxID=3154750 RepID=UPI003447FD5E
MTGDESLAVTGACVGRKMSQLSEPRVEEGAAHPVAADGPGRGDVLEGVSGGDVRQTSALGQHDSGGSAYAATVSAGLFGAVAHNGAAIVATIGSITIPWMKRSRAGGETAALVLAGNAGVGATFPFSGAFFILLAAPTVLPVLSARDVVGTIFVTGVWMVAMRLIIAYVIVKRRGVGAMAPEDIHCCSGRRW